MEIFICNHVIRKGRGLETWIKFFKIFRIKEGRGHFSLSLSLSPFSYRIRSLSNVVFPSPPPFKPGRVHRVRVRHPGRVHGGHLPQVLPGGHLGGEGRRQRRGVHTAGVVSRLRNETVFGNRICVTLFIICRENSSAKSSASGERTKSDGAQNKEVRPHAPTKYCEIFKKSNLGPPLCSTASSSGDPAHACAHPHRLF